MSKEQLTNWIISKHYLEYILYDYTPSIFRKGKKHPIEIMLKSNLFIITFSKMGEEDLNDKDIDVLESFTYFVTAN